MKKSLFVGKRLLLAAALVLSMLLGACGPNPEIIADGPDFNSLSVTGSVWLDYAEEFTIDEYGAYKLITIRDGGRFLVVPEDEGIPTNLPSDVIALKQPLDKTYLVSSSTVDLIREIGALDQVRFLGVAKGDLYIQDALDALENGQIVDAGKYNAPDYELLIGEGCNFVIENTMIYHNPDVKEKLEELGIPVFVDRSSYESSPLGRLEWIKLYGALYGKLDEATAFYDSQIEKVAPIMDGEESGLTVAFFYVTSDGALNVRKSNDYVSKMIDLAGGEYVLHDLPGEDDNSLSTMKMQMEDFYLQAKDADVIIYNSTIDGELNSIADLVDKNSLFSDFKAVKEGRVYCTGKNFFQESTAACEFIADVNTLLYDENANDFRFLKKLE